MRCRCWIDPGHMCTGMFVLTSFLFVVSFADTRLNKPFFFFGGPFAGV